MKKKISKILAMLLTIMLLVQTATTFVMAKEITSNATVYIKNATTGSYLYASGSSVNVGGFQEKNPYYIWSITKKTDGTFWIQNMGTNSYLCLEHASGKALLESTIYEVWMSSKWYIEGNADSSTIDNMWKSTRNSGTGGYLYTNSGNSDVFYGTTAQRWIFEDYSSTSNIPEDGVKGKLTNKVAADAIVVPGPNSDISSIGATMPYVRYDSEYAALGGGARIATSTNWDLTNIASQASNQSYVVLPSSGSYAEWRVNSSGNGVVMRFTLPDTPNGMGQKGSLDVYVNGSKVKTVDLTSYYMWQYLNGGASDTPGGGTACFAFDEAHFRLDRSLVPGDTIRIQSSGANGLTYGVDFLEIEETGGPIPQPAGSYSVVDFGAVPNDGIDDYAAISACVAAADANGKDVYFPAGTYHINQIWRLSASDMMITGAGMWYTNIQFTNSAQQSGGISGNGDGKTKNIEFCNLYINSNLRSRYGENAIYKGFMDVFDGRSLFHDLWVEHFECGFWIADYNGTLDYSDGIKIANCRIRNNLADGVNFCQGTSNATVYNCSIRNNGDDGLAMWNNNFMSAKDLSNNIFCYNTIDLNWRAGGIAIYGGNNHKIYNNYIRDCFMSSGIHLNTTFPGYKFDNTRSIQFANNTIIRSGCSYDTWRSEYGAVDLTGSVKNVTFDNTYIYDAQHDGIRLGDSVNSVVFNNLYIYGTGVDGNTPSYSSLPHLGAAIMSFGGNPSVTINGMNLRKIAYPDVYYLNQANVVRNNVVNEGNIAYTIPAYRAVGSLHTDHGDHNQVPTIIPTATPTATPKPTVTPIPTASPSVTPTPTQTPSPTVTPTPSVPYGNPDMIVTDITWSPANPTNGNQVTFSAVIKNIGTGVAPLGSINGVQFQVNGTSVSWSDIDKTQIQPGGSITVTAVSGPSGSATWTAKTGTYTITAWVNDVNRYPESNTNNNMLTKPLTVTEGGVQPTVTPTPTTGPYGNPDMIVTDITWSPASPVSGNKITFSAVIKNQGTGVAPAGSINGLQFQVNGTCVSWSDNNTTQIMPGQSVTVTANSGPTGSPTYTATAGTFNVMAWVNDINRYPESNTDNNTLTKTMTVR